MKRDTLVFVDVDDTPSTRYAYREPHFEAARRRNLACLVIAAKGRHHKERLYEGSDQVVFIDEITEQALYTELLRLGEHDYVRAVFCHAGDPSQGGQGHVGCVVAHVARRLGLRHASSSSILTCHDKFLTRQKLEACNLPSVGYALCHGEEELYVQAQRIGYPLIAKPRIGAASTFIKKCYHWEQLCAHSRLFRDRKAHMAMVDPQDESLLLEAYIEGVEGCVDCIIGVQDVHPVLLQEKLLLTEKERTFQENVLISPSTSFSSFQREEIFRYVVDCLNAVELKSSFAHVEFRMTTSGPIILEINPRLGGFYVDKAFRDLAGIDPYDLYLGILLGEGDIDEKAEKGRQQAARSQQSYAMFAFYPHKSGQFKGSETLVVNDRDLYHKASDVRQVSLCERGVRDLLIVAFLREEARVHH